MRILQFTRVSDGMPVYTQAEHISFVRQAEGDASKTLLVTISEREVITESLDEAVALWLGRNRDTSAKSWRAV